MGKTMRETRPDLELAQVSVQLAEALLNDIPFDVILYVVVICIG